MEASVVPLELALNSVDGSPSDIFFTYYHQPSIDRISITGGPVDGGTVVTIHGSGFSVFGLVPRHQSWRTDGGYSASHRINSRCKFGEVDVPVIDMSDVRAVCQTPPMAEALGVAFGNLSSVKVTLSLNSASEDYVMCNTSGTTVSFDASEDGGGDGNGSGEGEVGGDGADPSTSCLPSFAFYSVHLSSVTPYSGPTGGGTRIIVNGLGFGSMGRTDAYALPHGRRALCRFGAEVVNATVDGPRSLRCITPAAMEDGASSVHISVAINGVDFVGLPSRENPARAKGVGVGSALVDHSGYGGGVGGGLGDSGEEAEGRSSSRLLTFRYYEHPLLVSLSPIGGPLNGRTSVTLSASGPLPVRDWSELRCRFGEDMEVPMTAVARPTTRAVVRVAPPIIAERGQPRQRHAQGHHRAAAPRHTINTSRSFRGAFADTPVSLEADLGLTNHQVICLTPAYHIPADVEVTLSLNGQQFAFSPHVFYSSLVSAAIRGSGGASAEALPGLRYRFFEPPEVYSIFPRIGPVRGGTLLRVRGVRFLGNSLHGGRGSVKCRIGTGQASIVDGTIETDWQIKCRTPPSRTGLSTVLISLNNGADWYANSSLISPSAPHQQDPLVVFRHACDEGVPMDACLRDRGCGWCSEPLLSDSVATSSRAGASFDPAQAAVAAAVDGGRCLRLVRLMMAVRRFVISAPPPPPRPPLPNHRALRADGRT